MNEPTKRMSVISESVQRALGHVVEGKGRLAQSSRDNWTHSPANVFSLDVFEVPTIGPADKIGDSLKRHQKHDPESSSGDTTKDRKVIIINLVVVVDVVDVGRGNVDAVLYELVEGDRKAEVHDSEPLSPKDRSYNDGVVSVLIVVVLESLIKFIGSFF